MLRKTRPLKYSLHKATGQARVWIDGRDHYFGEHGTPESKRRYRELIKQWRIGREIRKFPSLTLAQLALLYVEHCKAYYVKGGTETSQVSSVKASLQQLLRPYRTLEVADFGITKLRRVRDAIISEGRSRETVNKYTGCNVRMIRWAVSTEYCGPSVLTALESVDGLRAGRTAAREPEAVEPVDLADIAAIEGYIGRRLWGAIQFQLHTAARPGESLIVRGYDLNMSGDVWVYTPARHKVEHHDKRRQILIGPKAKAVIREYLTTDLQAYLFGVPGTDRAYKRHSYTVAVRRACKRASVPIWRPNQLGHTAATRICGVAGIETAKTVLGHSDLRITEIYAQRDADAARAVVARIG